MNIIKTFLLIIALALLVGCADSSQTGLDKEIDLTVRIEVHQHADNSGNVTISPVAGWETVTGDTAQESAAVAEAQAQFKIPVAQQGGQANIESDTVDAAARQDNRLTDSQNTDNRKTDSDNPVNSTTTNTSNYPVTPESVEAEVTPEIPVIETDLPEPLAYQTKFHHTATGSSDGGKSLVMCPGQDLMFDSCSVGSVDIPFHGRDEGRLIYWNLTEEPKGDIVCSKNGQTYKFKADSLMVNGDC